MSAAKKALKQLAKSKTRVFADPEAVEWGDGTSARGTAAVGAASGACGVLVVCGSVLRFLLPCLPCRGAVDSQARRQRRQ